MCGMAGFICDNTFDMDLRAFRNLIMLNSLRGEDSTGMFDCVPEQKPSVMTWKTDLHPLVFITDKYHDVWLERWKKVKPRFAAAHCRAATKGKITKMNAHPFKHGHIIGMHNGTVERKFKNSDKFETDSEAIFYNISTMGLPDALAELRDASPAYALVWYDTKEKTLNFIRNSKRPLHYTKSISGTIYWSSEGAHLSMGVSNAMYSKATVQSVPFTTGVHYSLDVTKDRFEFKETRLREAEEDTRSYWSCKSEDWDNEEWWESCGKTADQKKDLSCTCVGYTHYDAKSDKWYTDYQIDKLKEARKRADNVVKLPPHGAAKEKKASLNDEVPFDLTSNKEVEQPQYPFGRGLLATCNEYEWRQKTRSGCACCGQKVVPGDTTIWLDDQFFMCLDCAEEVIFNDDHWTKQTDYLTEDQMDSIWHDYEMVTYVAEKD